MTQSEPDNYSPAFYELMAALGKTQDPSERQGALLRFYGHYAYTQAEYFLHDTIAAGALKPENDLGAMAQASLEKLLQVIYPSNAHFGLDFPAFADATRIVVEQVFFNRLNEQLALAITPPVGSA